MEAVELLGVMEEHKAVRKLRPEQLRDLVLQVSLQHQDVLHLDGLNPFPALGGQPGLVGGQQQDDVEDGQLLFVRLRTGDRRGGPGLADPRQMRMLQKRISVT